MTPAPPVIQSILADTSGTIDSDHSVRPGQLITLIVTGIPAGTTLPIKANVGGLDHLPVAVFSAANGTAQIQIVLSTGVSTGPQVPVTVSVDTRVSSPVTIPISSS